MGRLSAVFVSKAFYGNDTFGGKFWIKILL
jgi:hypothetical protein